VSAQPEIQAAVLAAIGELEREYETVKWSPDGSGGAYVTVSQVNLGERWSPSSTSVEVAIAFNYPYAPIYPFYTVASLTRADGGAYPAALQRVAWRGMEFTQISLRARRWEPAHDTVSTALRLVEHWFQTAA
jgi:hypothetical protein